MTIKEEILYSIQLLYSHFKYISFDPSAIEQVSGLLNSSNSSDWNSEYVFHEKSPRVLNYLLLFCALSFSYWRKPKWRKEVDGKELGGAYSMFYAIKEAVEGGIDLTDARVMSSLPFEVFAQLLLGKDEVEIPYLKERYGIMKEIGEVLQSCFDGQVYNLFLEGEYDANRINQLLVDNFQCYRDQHHFEGHTFKFYKKSQEFTSVVYEQFHGKELGDIKNMQDLTAASDYKLPQMLSSFGLLQYKEPLRTKIQNEESLEHNSREALEIRAATIYICEKIRKYLEEKEREVRTFEVSNMLWTISQKEDFKVLPYPRIKGIWV